RAHIELVGFPSSGELTVGRDAPPPRITARAYRWVIADRGSPDGWRPLLWSHVTPDLVGRRVPPLPPALEALGSQEGGTTVDAVERAAYETDDPVTPEILVARTLIKSQMNAGDGHDYEELQEVFAALIAKADQPSMGRTLRRLDVPGEVTFKFRGQR